MGSEIRLIVGGLGTFPGAKKPRVIWVGLSGEVRRIVEVRDSLEEAFSRIGYPEEKRPFRPHLTLGRVKGKPSEGLLERIEGKKDVDLGEMIIRGFHLIKSDLMPSGAVYTHLDYYPLP